VASIFVGRGFSHDKKRPARSAFLSAAFSPTFATSTPRIRIRPRECSEPRIVIFVGRGFSHDKKKTGAQRPPLGGLFAEQSRLQPAHPHPPASNQNS
jgi:hypothetical protein